MNIDFSIGLHIVGFLASRNDDLVSSAILATSFGTSPVVLRRVLARLNNADIVKTKRGANGGSQLARPSTDINLREVYEAACQKTELFARHPAGSEGISKIMGNYINEFYADAEQSMLKHLEAISVADMDKTIRPKVMEELNCK